MSFFSKSSNHFLLKSFSKPIHQSLFLCTIYTSIFSALILFTFLCLILLEAMIFLDEKCYFPMRILSVGFYWLQAKLQILSVSHDLLGELKPSPLCAVVARVCLSWPKAWKNTFYYQGFWVTYINNLSLEHILVMLPLCVNLISPIRLFLALCEVGSYLLFYLLSLFQLPDNTRSLDPCLIKGMGNVVHVSGMGLISLPWICGGYYKMFHRMTQVLEVQYNTCFQFLWTKRPRTNDFTWICCNDRKGL